MRGEIVLSELRQVEQVKFGLCPADGARVAQVQRVIPKDHHVPLAFGQNQDVQMRRPINTEEDGLAAVRSAEFHVGRDIFRVPLRDVPAQRIIVVWLKRL